MNELQSNFFVIALSVLTIIVSLVSMIVSIAQATITQAIANRALDVERFRYKKESFSYIKIKCSVWQQTSNGENTIHVDIFNHGFGVVKIESINIAGFLEAPTYLNDKQIEYPLNLKMNSSITLQLKVYQIFINSGILVLENLIKSTSLVFKYFTESGTRYQQSFTYDSELNGHFGQPIEIY